MRYFGGGHRKVIRIVDFKRNKDGVPAVVKTIESPSEPFRLASHCYFMLMVKKDILLLPIGLQSWCDFDVGRERCA